MTNLIVPFALILTISFPQQPATPEPAKTTTLHIDSMHLDYSYPSSFQSMSDMADDLLKEEKGKTDPGSKLVGSCLTVPLVGNASSDASSLIIVTHIDLACMKAHVASVDLSEIVKGTVSIGLKRYGEPVMFSVATYELASHKAAVTSGVVLPGKYKTTLNGIASCVIDGTEVICWEFLSDNCTKLTELMALPVTFAGRHPEAVIPAKFALACTP